MKQSSYRFVLKDAFRQIFGRVMSACAGFVVVTIVTSYLGPLRYGDYGTIMAYFAFWSSLSDLGLYVLGLKELGNAKKNFTDKNPQAQQAYQRLYSKIVYSRLTLIGIVYVLAIGLAYLLPSYTQNQYLVRGLPLGMIFSATAMSAGIIQLPLQLFQHMKHVSFSVIFARIAQLLALGLLVYVFFPKHSFGGAQIPLKVFLRIFATVCLSSLVQFLYTWYKSRQYLRLQVVKFLGFTRDTIKQHRKYGVGFFLSSAPLLFVVILLSQLYPTVDGFNYTGIWTLPIQLITILLVIPPALGNSMLHNVSSLPLTKKKRAFGKFFSLMVWIGVVIFCNSLLFAPFLINIVGDASYLSEVSIWSYTFRSHLFTANIGSDIVLVFLSIVLLLSFLKQVFVYLFVATNRENVLFRINVISMVIGSVVGFFLIKRYHLWGGIMTQLIFEILFFASSLWQAKRLDVFPTLNRKRMGKVGGFFLMCIVGILILMHFLPSRNVALGSKTIDLTTLFVLLTMNGLVLVLRKKPLWRVASGLLGKVSG